jgi:hypothetical protein
MAAIRSWVTSEPSQLLEPGLSRRVKVGRFPSVGRAVFGAMSHRDVRGRDGVEAIRATTV